MDASMISRVRSDARALCALAFLAPALASLAPLGIWIPAVAAALAVALRRIAVGGPWPLARPALVAILFTFAAWGAVSAVWAIDLSLSLETAARLLLVAAALAVLVDAAARLNAVERARFRRWLVYGGVSGVVLTLAAIAAISAYTVWVQQAPMTENRLAFLNRSGSVIAILVWPVAVSIAQNHGRRAAAAFIVLSASAVFLTAPATPLLAFAVGASAFAVAWFSPSLAKALLLAAFAGCIMIVPFLDSLAPWASELLVANFSNPNSEVHRFVIWQFAAEYILERPFFGWGLEAARGFPGGDAELFLFNAADGTPLTGAAIPLHTHNATIQIWLELGLVGVALFAALFVLAVRAIPRASGDRPGQAAATATLATGLVMVQLSFGIWQGWWLATLGVAAVVTAAVVGRSSAARRTAVSN